VLTGTLLFSKQGRKLRRTAACFGPTWHRSFSELSKVGAHREQKGSYCCPCEYKSHFGTGQKFAAVFWNSFSSHELARPSQPLRPVLSHWRKRHRLPIRPTGTKSPAGRFVPSTTVLPSSSSETRIFEKVPNDGVSILQSSRPILVAGCLSPSIYAAMDINVQ